MLDRCKECKEPMPCFYKCMSEKSDTRGGVGGEVVVNGRTTAGASQRGGW